ncbi:hypothetical protein HJC23_011972 [Cyclotella cryptica]|uniref:Uncharacterized protein n=1 Tax=Cyclotella cryptica TaxID=29204 RepID=A0ABD3QR48_9STRA|eukprot:CCRYP_003011-RA/>CCRYP_003011-RA protein AED:0.07 eAED:0.07 QI:103/1/1/1/1/1/2/496/315
MIQRSLLRSTTHVPNLPRQRYQHHCNYNPHRFSSASNVTSNVHPVSNNHDDELHSRQSALYDEASSLTRALYRRCVKSVKVLAQCNQQDEENFAARENSELTQFDTSSSSSSNTKDTKSNHISLMSPPVNRANELSSRANYYAGFCREHFEGHWNLLGIHGFHMGSESGGSTTMMHGLGHVVGGQENNRYQGGHHHLGGQMESQYVGRYGASSHDEKERDNHHYLWREEQIQQFVYLIRSGEEKRTWILQDYDFDDPCRRDGWPQELERRLQEFEGDANLLVREMYHKRGWTHSDDIDRTNMMDDDDDSEDEDDL